MTVREEGILCFYRTSSTFLIFYYKLLPLLQKTQKYFWQLKALRHPHTDASHAAEFQIISKKGLHSTLHPLESFPGG